MDSQLHRFSMYVENILEKELKTNDVVQHNHVIGLDFLVHNCPYCLKFGNKQTNDKCLPLRFSHGIDRVK